MSPAGAGELAVSWEPPDDEGGSDILLYILRWRETGDSKDTGSASVSGTAHTITGLSAGTEYTVQVLAYHKSGGAPASPEKTGTPG